MSYTFLEQQNKLSSLLGDSNTSSDDMFPLATRKLEINRGEIHFARDSKLLKEYATGVVASMEFSMPTDWVETYKLIVDNVVITNSREISLNDWEKYYNYGGTDPYYYYWQFSGTRKLKLLGNTSINGNTYYLYYFKKPTTALNLDADESLFPDEYREASVFYAASQLLEQIGKTDLADRYLQKYLALVQQAMIEGERHFVNRENPVPDLGDELNETDVDREGKGYDY